MASFGLYIIAFKKEKGGEKGDGKEKEAENDVWVLVVLTGEN